MDAPVPDFLEPGRYRFQPKFWNRYRPEPEPVPLTPVPMQTQIRLDWLIIIFISIIEYTIYWFCVS